MKLRLAAPSLLVDLRRIPGLHGIRARERRLADRRDDPHRGARGHARARRRLPRPRGRSPTAGAQPRDDRRLARPRRSGLRPPHGAADLRGQRHRPGRGRSAGDRGRRPLPGYLQTAIGPEEILTEVRVPALDGYGFGYEKFTRRAEDWAMVAVCAVVKESDGVCEDVRIGLTPWARCRCGRPPWRTSSAGGPLDADTIAAAAELAAEGTNPPRGRERDARLQTPPGAGALPARAAEAAGIE